MTTSGLIPWEYCKNNLEMGAKKKSRDKELTELLIFSTSAEIEIFTDRNLFEREIRELHDGYMQKKLLKLLFYISHQTDFIRIEKHTCILVTNNTHFW